MTFWAGEVAKQDLPPAALAQTYGPCQPPSSLELRWDADRTAVAAFLGAHYQPGSQSDSAYAWLLRRAALIGTLHARCNDAVMACMVGVPLPVRFPGVYTGPALLGTLLCVHPCLRRTGLTARLLRAVIRRSADLGHAVRLSTTTHPLPLAPLARIPRYLVLPPPAGHPLRRHRAVAVGARPPASAAAVLQFLQCTMPDGGVAWDQLPHAFVTGADTELFALVSPENKRQLVGAAILVPASTTSRHVFALALAGRAQCADLLTAFLEHMGRFRPDHTRRRQPVGVVLDACFPSTVCPVSPDLPRGRVVPEYRVYLHNVALPDGPAPRAGMGVPLL